MSALTLTLLGHGVYFAHGPRTNWLLLVDGDDVALIDSGYPRDLPLLLESLRRVGRRPEQIVAGIITHGHADHIGGFARLRQRHDFPLYAHAHELPNIRRDVLHQVNLKTIAPHLWRPRVAHWALTAARAGGTDDVALPDVQAAQPGRALDLPCAPQIVPLPGHTPGHAGVLLRDAGALACGDALVTAHHTLRGRGCAVLPSYFHHDTHAAHDAAAQVQGYAVDAIAPGHGPLALLTAPGPRDARGTHNASIDAFNAVPLTHALAHRARAGVH